MHPSVRVPFSLHVKRKETLGRIGKKGVITKLDKSTDWVNSLAIAEKKDGSLRLCLYPRDLNKAIKREHYKIPTDEGGCRFQVEWQKCVLYPRRERWVLVNSIGRGKLISLHL